MSTAIEVLSSSQRGLENIAQHEEITPIKTQFPFVSVVIPVYNGEKYICAAIDSVLAQTYGNYEIIVIDDGSTDDTRDRLNAYQDKIRYVYQANEGSASARNLGIQIAKGELIAFLDADDYWVTPHKLAKQIACFHETSDLGCVNTGWHIIDDRDRRIKTVQPWHKAPDLDLKTWLKEKCVRTSAMMFHRAWLEKVGGFDAELKQSHDVDLILRLSLAGCRTIWLKEETVCYRQHEANTTGNNLRQAQCVQEVLDKFFANQNLPNDILALESEVKYNTLVWLAWYQYRAKDFDKMSELLSKSLPISPYLRIENIAHWLGSFERYSRERGEKFNGVLLTKSFQWQELINSVLEIKNLAQNNTAFSSLNQPTVSANSSTLSVKEPTVPAKCQDYEQQGDLFFAQKNWHKASLSYVAALKIKPDRFPLYEKIAEILKAKGTPILPDMESTTPSTYGYLPPDFLAEYCGLSADDFTDPSIDSSIKYISVQPENRATFIASKTLSEQKIPQCLQTQSVNVASAFVAIVSEGRAWGDKAVSGVITQENKIIADTYSGSFGLVLSSTDLPAPKYIDGTVAFLSVRWGQRGYFHWMFDILARIEIIKASGIDLDNIDYFVVNKCDRDFQIETFKHLGIPREKIIESLATPHIQAKSLIVPSLPKLRAYRDAQWACQALRDNYLNTSIANPNPAFEKIYINRSNVAHRQVVNENQVIAKLESWGFTSVAFESMSFFEQVSCMASAKVVVAVHGAGLSNLVFCAPGTKVIEIFSPEHLQNTYWRISNLCQLEHHFLLSDELDSQLQPPQRSVKKDVRINLKDLERLLEEIDIEPTPPVNNTTILVKEEREEGDVNLAKYHRALEQEPKNSQHYLELGNALVAAGKPDRAMVFYKIGLKTQPNNSELQMQLGRVSPQDSLIVKRYRQEIESIKPQDVKITFATIMLNEEEYIGKNLEQHYSLCDEWILVEGTCLGYPTERVTPDGLSKDRTAEIIKNFPDPENKIRFIQHGWTKATGEDAKSEMRNRYAEVADTGILVVIDADEFYRRNHLKKVLQKLTETKSNAWRLPQMHLWKTSDRVIKGGYYDVGHNRIYSWHKNLRYVTNHNHPETECGHLWHECGEYVKSPRKFVKQNKGFTHPDFCCFHYGFAKSEENMRDKTNYYIGRGEDTTRPTTTACRTGWFEDKVPEGCEVLPWQGRLPEVFEKVWSHYYV